MCITKLGIIAGSGFNLNPRRGLAADSRIRRPKNLNFQEGLFYCKFDWYNNEQQSGFGLNWMNFHNRQYGSIR
jgi:hypothetical protein